LSKGLVNQPMHQSWSWRELERTGRGRRRICDDGGDDGRVGQWDDSGQMVVVMMKWDFARARDTQTERSRVAKFCMGSKGGYIEGTYRSQDARARREVPQRYRDITAREELPAARRQQHPRRDAGCHDARAVDWPGPARSAPSMVTISTAGAAGFWKGGRGFWKASRELLEGVPYLRSTG
jgi:hypothetical protein